MQLSILGYSATLGQLSSTENWKLKSSFLIDCGEGAQVQLRKQKLNFQE